MNRHFLFAALVLFSATALHAQEQRLPGVIDRAVPKPLIPLDRTLDAVPQSEIDPLKPAAGVRNPNQVVATLKSIVFEGATAVSDADLQQVVSSYLNRPVTNQDIAQLKYDVTKYFYDRGYILVRVVTPAQKLSSGVLKVEIFEANIGDVSIQSEGVLNSTVANAFASRLDSGDVFTERSVESVVSDLNDLPNIRATLNLRPGQAFKTTDLAFLTQAADEDEQRVTLDNYGSELTGSAVAAVHLEKSNLLNLGERLYTDLRHSEDDLWSAAIGARTPLAVHNLMLDISYLHSENDIGDRLAFLNASGETDVLSVGVSSQLINKRSLKWDVGTGLEVRKHESFLTNVTDTKDDIRKLYLSTSVLSNNQSRVLLASAKLRRGVDIFGASEQGDAGLSRAQGNPDAFIFEPLVYANVRSPISDGDFKAQVSGQIASDTLLSSDLFVLGGYGSVRGFEPAETTGEAGYQFSVEYNHNIRVDALPEVALRAGPFVDGGAVYNRLAGQVQDTHLYSAGLGLEADASLLPVGKTRLRVDVARTLGSYESDQVQGTSGFFRLTQAF